MHAIKIDIKKEDLDVPDNKPYLDFAEFPPMSARLMREGADFTAENITVKRLHYMLMKVKHPETGEIFNYFVNADQRKLWNDLLHVSDGFINDKIADANKRFKDHFFIFELPQIEQQYFSRGRNSVKDLPWWKRLFKKF